MQKRIPLKRYGPINSMPITCATKAKPQMAAVKSSSSSYFKVLKFIPEILIQFIAQ